MLRLLNWLGLKRWKHTINYAVRNIEVGDGEQTRLWEDPDFFLEGFKEEGLSVEDMAAAAELINEPGNYDSLLDLLLPHISHKGLYRRDWDRWEFMTWNDPDEWGTYEEWIAS